MTQGNYVAVVFNGRPGHPAPRFVECEDPQGRAIRAGSWVDRQDGTWELRVETAAPAAGALMALAQEVRAVNDANGWTRGAELRDRQAEDGNHIAELKQTRLAHQITELMLVVTEAAEAVEELRAGYLPHDERYKHHHSCPTAWHAPEVPTTCTCTPKPLGVPSELADVIVRVLDFASTWGVDLDKAVRDKLAYNATRGLHHGGKAI